MPDLWKLVWSKPEVDPTALGQAIDEAAARDDLDYRTRLLIHEATAALEEHWGEKRYRRWIERCRARARIDEIRAERFAEVGFPSLKERLMEATTPETIRQYLRELSTSVRQAILLPVGGSVALILSGYLSRSTEDIDVVDEVPAGLRELHSELDRLARSCGLRLTHFQSHFLPAGWQNRLHPLEPFGKIEVRLVDVIDVFLSKLFSAREKDRDDLRQLLPALDREIIERRLGETCAALLAEPRLKENAARNWYVLTGQALG